MSRRDVASCMTFNECGDRKSVRVIVLNSVTLMYEELGGFSL